MLRVRGKSVLYTSFTLTLLRSEQQVVFGENTVQLTPIQFRLLCFLAENKNKVMTKPVLYQAVLNREFSCYDRSLDIHLSRIRKKLSAMGVKSDRIVTVHSKGYCFR